MSGHSKWSTIKRQKQGNDAKRGQIFTKLANAITLAVREGGGCADPADNFKLRLIVEKARSANMPKDKIDRAIARAAGKDTGGVELSEALYEGFGPEGSAVLVSVVTDNKNRAQSLIRMIFDKGGGVLGSSGAAGYLFEHVAMVQVAAQPSVSFDDILAYALDLEAIDVRQEDGSFVVYAPIQKLHVIKEFFDNKGVAITETALVYQPKETILIKPESQQLLMDLLTTLEEIDDVQEVFTNVSFSI